MLHAKSNSCNIQRHIVAYTETYSYGMPFAYSCDIPRLYSCTCQDLQWHIDVAYSGIMLWHATYTLLLVKITTSTKVHCSGICQKTALILSKICCVFSNSHLYYQNEVKAWYFHITNEAETETKPV